MAPEPFALEPGLVRELEFLGRVLLQFYRAVNLLYRQSAAGRQPAWVAQLLDQGKPADLLAWQRHPAFKNELPRVIRPDLLLTDEGFVISELDAVPGGIGLAAWLNQTYAQPDLPGSSREIVGGARGMVEGFAGIFGDAPAALRHLRAWQALHVERARRASQARSQAASLQTELLRIRRERDAIDARRRASERAKTELEAINRQLAARVREVQSLQAELKQQALRDFLTGLYNRRHRNEVLPALFALARREGRPLAVALIDLDHFKAVNDRYGHDAGDRLLAAFGQLLARRLRRSDVACRYGGEEFCVLMPHTGAPAAAAQVRALLARWRAFALALDGDRGFALRGCTFSAGVADTHGAPDSIEALLKAADDSMLEAKRLGRDRVVVHGG